MLGHLQRGGTPLGLRPGAGDAVRQLRGGTAARREVRRDDGAQVARHRRGAARMCRRPHAQRAGRWRCRQDGEERRDSFGD